ncbi:MAG: T9SS type A sorting domain-containing protein [Bacteroidia bacterium]|nr:T9SS type A sorting domain-containing protein [Bacteroidia bacterium]
MNQFLYRGLIGCLLTVGGYVVHGQGNAPIPGGCGVVGPNLVRNPEFDLGNVDFSSDYLYNPVGYICQYGEYTVSHTILNDPNVVCYNAPGFNLRSIWAASDRINPGVGKLMLIDPSEATGASDDVWRQTIPVCPNTDYTFSVYAKNLYYRGAPNYSNVNPRFELEINNEQIFGYFVDGVILNNTSFVLGRQRLRDSAEWIQISGTWNSGIHTTATMVVRNLVTGSQGNDLALDGMFLGICGRDVSINVTGDRSQCADTGYTAVTLEVSPATQSSQWLYYQWYKDDTVLLQSDNAPNPYLVQPAADGSHLGKYSLKAFNDPSGQSCAQVSAPISLFNSCLTSFPVEWLDVSATVIGNQIELSWVTATEVNNRAFEVQLAGEDKQFITQRIIPGAGNSTEPRSYRYLTHALAPGTYFMQIRQIDVDGQSSLSPVTESLITLPDEFVAEVWPNPAQSSFVVDFTLRRTQAVTAELMNIEGKKIMTLYQGEAEAARLHSFTTETSHLPGGVYILRLTGATFSDVRRVVIAQP